MADTRVRLRLILVYGYGVVRKEVDVSHEAGPAPDGARARSAISVAVVEQQVERRQHVLTLTAQCGDLDVYLLRDDASYVEIFGASPGPDVLLVSLDAQPAAALAAAERIMALVPSCTLMVYGSAGALDALPRAMALGARRCLAYPFDVTTLRAAIDDVAAERQRLVETAQGPAPSGYATSENAAPVSRPAKVVAVYSPKGGVGTTTLTVNLACVLRQMRRRVALVDGNLSFGNVDILLNMPPGHSMLELADDTVNSITDASVNEALVAHDSGVRVLMAPRSPVDAERLTAAHLQAIIAALRVRYDYVVVDTWSSYDERTLAILEAADQVLVPTTPEMQSIRNLTTFLRIMQLLDHPADKLIPVLMRADSVDASYVQAVERHLAQPLLWRIGSDGKRVTQSVIDGAPFVLTDPEASVSRDVYNLACMVDEQQEAEQAPARRARPFARATRGVGARYHHRTASASRLWIASLPLLITAVVLGHMQLSGARSQAHGHRVQPMQQRQLAYAAATIAAGQTAHANVVAQLTAQAASIVASQETATAEAGMLNEIARATYCAGTGTNRDRASQVGTASPTATPSFSYGNCHG